MERGPAEVRIKKGPWTAEEDEVLINFVKKNGPRDWSSIRSKGLLPRTGKSCRLRWVNKLRPNLKIGCKFSSEEERVVIDLQGRFGNKWATIASYLPGRTDNDVKNFWSTRQKRLARNLKSPSQQNKSEKNKGKALDVDEIMPTFQVPKLNAISVEEETSSQCQPSFTSSMGNHQVINMLPLPDLMIPNMTSLHTLDIPETDNRASTTESPLQLCFTHLPHPKLDLPLLPAGGPDFVEALGEPNFSLDPNFWSPFVELECSCGNEVRANNDKIATPDSFFDDFPSDMFDYIEPIPSSSAP